MRTPTYQRNTYGSRGARGCGTCAWLIITGLILGALLSGCGQEAPSGWPDYLKVSLDVAGQQVEPALIDTGGGYELLLREPYGLKLVGTGQIIAFTGAEIVGVTEPFAYAAGGVEAVAGFALVGSSICDCNALGFEFFRRSGIILEVDFPAEKATLHESLPPEGITIPFSERPEALSGFDGALVELEVTTSGQTRSLIGVLDTGAPNSVLSEGAFPNARTGLTGRLAADLTHDQLGTVRVNLPLFDNPDLPELIVGLDVMRLWADVWFFRFDEVGGSVTVILRREGQPSEPDATDAGILATKNAARRSTASSLNQ